jgi:hypothetical protein
MEVPFSAFTSSRERVDGLKAERSEDIIQWWAGQIEYEMVRPDQPLIFYSCTVISSHYLSWSLDKNADCTRLATGWDCAFTEIKVFVKVRGRMTHRKLQTLALAFMTATTIYTPLSHTCSLHLKRAMDDNAMQNHQHYTDR